jgi:hypothetical protein
VHFPMFLIMMYSELPFTTSYHLWIVIIHTISYKPVFSEYFCYDYFYCEKNIPTIQREKNKMKHFVAVNF